MEGDLSSMQLRILAFLSGLSGWYTRKQIGVAIGRGKGFSKAFGAPTNRPMKPDSLEARGFVERRDDGTPFHYRISELGEELIISMDLPPSATNYVLPDEESEPDASHQLPEGARTKVWVNRFERNPKARHLCLEEHGTSCVVCGMSFGAVYGEIADGFIHVHHLVPLSEIGGEHEIDPATDLRPVCPNCHAVIHLGGACRSIDDVKGLLSTTSGGDSRRGALLVETLRESNDDEPRSLVVFSHETCVSVSCSVLDPRSYAIDLLREYGPVVIGTPSADFSLVELDDGAGWFVRCHHPDIATLVLRKNIDAGANEFEVGLYGRERRAMDAVKLEVIYVDNKAKPK